ncbi:MAG: GNAT family N-acetyltransferase [Rhodobacteraceae bacterium]|nr:GNAT family N-acetyltransferase [Paracoccaceae bacterium]
MTLIPTLETERLKLRPFVESDIDHEADFYTTPRAEFVGGQMPREQVWRMVAAMLGHWQLRGYGFWAIEETATGRFAGHAGLWFPDGWPEREIGWLLMGWAEGKGYAREAALAARAYAYDTLEWTTAISLIAPGNTRSIALAERLGATRETTFQHQRLGSSLIYRHPGAHDLAEDGGMEAYA